MKTKTKVVVKLDSNDKNNRIVQLIRKIAHAISDDMPDLSWEEVRELASDRVGGQLAQDKEAEEWFREMSKEEQEQILKMV